MNCEEMVKKADNVLSQTYHAFNKSSKRRLTVQVDLTTRAYLIDVFFILTAER